MKRLRTFSPAFTHTFPAVREKKAQSSQPICSKTRATVTVALLMTRLKNRTTGSRKNICASPAAFRQHFYGNSIAQRCGDFKLRRPRPRSPP